MKDREFAFFSKFTFAVFIISVGCGFQHGYHTGVVNIPAEVCKKWIEDLKTYRLLGQVPPEREIMVIWLTALAIFSAGGIVGASLIGYLADRCGRKKTLILNNFLSIIATAFLIATKSIASFEMFLLGRLLTGLNVGINSGICQIYLTEIAPDEIRGAVACCHQLVISAAILLSEVIGFVLGNEKNWFLIFTIPLIPAVLQLICLPFCPESPKYLLMTEDDEERTKIALSWYRGSWNVYKELEQLKQEDNLVKQMHTDFYKLKVSHQSSQKNTLAVCAALTVGQQICGINTIFERLAKCFVPCSLIAISLSFATALSVLPVIMIVDRIGRRPLLVTSFLGMSLSILMFTGCLAATKNESSVVLKCFVLLFVFLFHIAYSLGAGPIVRFITAELTTYQARSGAVALTSVIHWFCTFMVVISFLPLKNAVGAYSFLVFVILNLYFCCYTLLRFPESSKMPANDIIIMYN